MQCYPRALQLLGMKPGLWLAMVFVGILEVPLGGSDLTAGRWRLTTTR